MTAQEFAKATRPERDRAEQKAGEDRVLGLLAKVASEDPERVASAKRAMAAEPAAFKLAPLAQALRCRPASLRIYAAEELGRLRDARGVPPLLRRAIEDDDASVRAAAAEALRSIGSGSTIQPLARALDSRYDDVRVRAAEAIALLGDELGYPAIIYKWEARSGDFPRVYLAQTTQISYIQDFDVEVAQTSFIADPIVGVLQEGVVQAFKILATEQSFTFERAAFHKALTRMAGTDLGDDPRAWRAWWNEHEERLLTERSARLARR
jgi:HEAT repeat protein